MTELLAPGATLERLFTGAVWAEGPVWIPQERVVRWSDIPNDRILAFDATTGTTRVHREHVEYTNGRTLDREGRVVQCSQGRRSVEREIDGEPVTIVDRWEGGRFNSPNDVVVASDGTIWFTDPPYGILESGREGHPGEQEYGGCYVFRLDERTGEVRPVVTELERPNGIAFSPDESVLYVSDTSETTPAIHAYDVDVARGEVSGGRVFATVEPPASDGFRVDVEGRVWTSSGDSVQVLAPDGALLLRVPVPEVVANVCFGGEDGHDLYVTATTSLYRIRTATTAAPRPAPPA